MRKSLVILGLVLTMGASAQIPFATPQASEIIKAKAVDQAKYRITYRLKFKNSVKDKDYQTDTRIVQIGKKCIKDYSQLLHHQDSIRTKNAQRGIETYPSMSQSVFPYEIINNHSEAGTQVSYRMSNNLGTLRYFDHPAVLEWKLEEGAQKVLGFECKKATTRFGGRDYTAWYAPSLRVNAGPYKFKGLPGLILKVEDSQKKYIWTAVATKNVCEPIEEHIYGDQKNTDATKAKKTILKMFQAPVSTVLATGIKIKVVQNGKIKTLTSKDDAPIPYEPIELEENK